MLSLQKSVKTNTYKQNHTYNYINEKFVNAYLSQDDPNLG
jgi:hypothetical protein